MNQVKPKIIYGNWLYQSSEANALGARYLALMQYGLRRVGFQIELKDSDPAEIGRIVEVDSKYLTDPDGGNHEFKGEIIKKEFVNIDTLKLEILEMPVGGYTNLPGGGGGGGGGGGDIAKIAPADPILYAAVSNTTGTTVQLQLVSNTPVNHLLDTFQPIEFKMFTDTSTRGFIRIQSETICYNAIAYNSTTKRLTLTVPSTGRGWYSSTPATHPNSSHVWLLYPGAASTARLDWVFIGNAANHLDDLGAGSYGIEGYEIW
jgi:hypothetical protein